jgi:WD40 repeat protein
MSSDIRKALELICEKANPPYSPFTERTIELEDIGAKDLVISCDAFDHSYLRGLNVVSESVHYGYYVDFRGVKKLSRTKKESYKLYDSSAVPRGNLIYSSGHHAPVTSLKKIHDGRILSICKDLSFRVWRRCSGAWYCEATFYDCSDEIKNAFPLSDGRIVSVSPSGEMKIWVEGNGFWKSKSIFKEPQEESIHLVDVLVSIDNSIFCLTGGRIRVIVENELGWSFDYGVKFFDDDVEFFDDAVQSFSLLDSGALLVESGSGKVYLFNEGEKNWHLDTFFDKNSDSIKDAIRLGDDRVVKNIDGKVVAISRLSAGGRYCEAALPLSNASASSVAITPSGRVVAASSDYSLRIWLSDNGRWNCEAVLEGHRGVVRAIVVLNEHYILSSCDHEMKTWLFSGGMWRNEATIYRVNDWVLSLAVLGDGRLMVGSSKNVLSIWNKQRDYWVCEEKYHDHAGSVRCATLTSDGRLVTGSYDCTIKIWGEVGYGWGVQGSLEGHLDWVLSVHLLSDGRLVSSSSDQTLKVWSEDDGKWYCESTLKGHQGFVRSVSSLDDGRLISGSSDQSIKVWSRCRGEWGCVSTLNGHKGWVLSLSVLNDGRIVSASDDFTLKVWREISGKWSCETTLSGHCGFVRAVAVSSENLIFSGSSDHSIRLWRELGNKWECISTSNPGISAISSIVCHAHKLYVTGRLGFAVLNLCNNELVFESRILFHDSAYQQINKRSYAVATTPFNKVRYWQTAIINGKRLPADPDLHKYTYYRCENNAILPAYEFPHLIDWIYEDNDLNKPRTLIMYNPGHEPGATASQETE